MPVLRTSPLSPFGRKVKISAHLLGLMDRITVEPADTLDPNDSLRRQNPLGKIPILILEDGEALYDSAVIVEYLDDLAGGGRIVPTGPARFRALCRQALADGILDAALLQVYEGRFRPEEARNAAWVEHQAGKVARALAHAQETLPNGKASVDVGDVALACALGYLDLRFAGSWRAEHPRLEAWLESFETRVPAFAQTRPSA